MHKALSSIPSTGKKKKPVNMDFSWAWWCMSIIPTLGRLRQEDYKFKAGLGYIVRPFLNKHTKKSKQTKFWSSKKDVFKS
jgi:ubiquinone/menaquinone biosynthesis C-methylase UbiE